MRTLLHLSDIHFGRFDEALRKPLQTTVARLNPNLVVLSGDLTQRAKPSEFRQAREFLADLPLPQLVVPGNHDVPLHNVLARLSQPLTNYKRYISSDLHPVFEDDEIAVLGINTARSLIWKNGRVNARQIARIQKQFCKVASGVVKVLVTHHPFDLPEPHTARDLVGRAGVAMRTVAGCGVDLLLAGHFHISRSGMTALRYKDAKHSSIFVQAGTLSTRQRGEASAFNVIRIDSPTIAVEQWCWSTKKGKFAVAETQEFRFSTGGWSPAG